MTAPVVLDNALISRWVDDPHGPVALHLRQALLPVEGAGAVIFPPTYADIGYNIDTLSDGTRVATIDSVGSQANRMEPIFKHAPFSELVPQVTIIFEEGTNVSLLDVGHRLADASVRHSALGPKVADAFAAFLRDGNADAIAGLAPTSLVFGAWDSRGAGAKLPRIVQSSIRAFDVSELKRSAVYTPAVDYAAVGVFDDEDKAKAEGNTKSPLAQMGFVHVPAGDAPGGIIAHGGIIRDVTVNLIALRRLHGGGPQRTTLLRHYILGLALVAAAEPQDGFLRQGCLLVPDAAAPTDWVAVKRTGERQNIALTPEAQNIALTPEASLGFAHAAAAAFGVAPPRNVAFERESARKEVNDKKAGKGAKKDKASASTET